MRALKARMHFWLDETLRLARGLKGPASKAEVRTLYLIVIAVAAFSIHVSHGEVTTTSFQQATKVSRASETRSCERLNRLRATVNRSSAQDYAFDSLFSRLLAASLHHQTASIKRSPGQEKHTQEFLAKLNDDANAKEWIALTNCARAIGDPTYQPPRPHTFARHRSDPLSGMPPKSVFGHV